MTRRMLLFSAAAAALLALLYLWGIEGFLAVTRPVPGEVLVVEGWFSDRPAMAEAAQRARSGGYRLVLCVSAEDPDGARRTADRLQALGLDPRRIATVPNPDRRAGNTRGAARAARDWLRREHPEVTRVDVFTLGVHARKSWRTFARVFGPDFQVGVIAGNPGDYIPGRWWASGTGWYLVLRNTAGYLDATLRPGGAQR